MSTLPTHIYTLSLHDALPISQVTDDDLGTNSGVNIRTNHFRFDYGLAKKISLQSLIYIQRELRNSGDFPNFFVPLNAFTRSEEHTSELQSRGHLVCRLLLEKK